MIFFLLLSDFAYYFLSILFKKHISRKLQCFGMIVSTKGIDEVLKIYMLSLSDILFPKNITVTVLDKNVMVLTFKEYMLE